MEFKPLSSYIKLLETITRTFAVGKALVMRKQKRRGELNLLRHNTINL